jgi:protein ImuA
MTNLATPSGAQALRDFPVPSRSKAGGLPARLCPEEIAALSKRREARWRPGLADQPFHSEIFASARDAAGAGLALALARDALRIASSAAAAGDAPSEVRDRRHVLWVQEARAIRLGGRPCLHGLPADLRERLIHVEAQTPEDALFALEEGLRCRDLACVIGEIAGNPRSLDFTASRRLSLAAERHGVALWLVRMEARADLSSARMRWRVAPAPSQPCRWNPDAPGAPAWKAELFRARAHAPGQWTLRDDPTGLTLERPAENAPQDHNFGPALARYRRIGRPGAAPDPRHLVRATVGRSLAARARM